MTRQKLQLQLGKWVKKEKQNKIKTQIKHLKGMIFIKFLFLQFYHNQIWLELFLEQIPDQLLL